MRRHALARLTGHATSLPVGIAVATAFAGIAAAVYYARLGLVLTHYDARAHLVVARRILDSLTPGWQQIGAVWLPLPHLLNMLPVQVDAWYRDGTSAIALSIAATALAAGSFAAMVLRTTGSTAGALAGAVLLVANPNMLYLQSTPMTETLLFGLAMAAIAATARATDATEETQNKHRGQATEETQGRQGRFARAGALLAAACLTRYEAWAITGAVIAIALFVLLRRGTRVTDALREVAVLAAFPGIAILLFSMNSRWVVGEWFTTGGFFVAENVEALGHPAVAWRQIDEGLTQLSGKALVWAGYAGALLIAIDAIRSTRRASLALLLALTAAAALPMVAYVRGHPFRIRYDLPLVVAAAALAGAGIGLLHRRLQWLAAAVLVGAAIVQAPPFDRDAPLVRESQREVNAMAGRRSVTDYLRAHYDGATIMMSMGSLAHYMHDLSSIGMHLRHFLHEGNGKPWEFAMLRPAGRAGWLLIEEQAEGGDVLFHAAKRERWLEGFEKVAEGGGVALYRAVKTPNP